MRGQLTDNEMIQIRCEKLDELRAQGKDPHRITKFDASHFSVDIKSNFDALEGETVTIAGRLMSKRGHGKIAFFHVQDTMGSIQVLAKLDTIGEQAYPEVKKLDMGDIIGVKGTVMKTNAGEITVTATEITLLTKSLQLLPEKFHGLKDLDTRYRQRYVDLIVNPEVKDVFRKRSRIVSAIREYLDQRDFLEVETPILNTIAGGANARPFITHHNTLDIDMYLRIANELYLKRLVVGGFDRVYEMGRMFRNEGMDTKHNPEYTAIEIYQAYTDYEGMMALTENLVAYVCQKVNGTTKINYQGTELDFTPPWNRMTMTEAVRKYSGVDFSEIKTDEEAQAVAKEKHVQVESYDGKGKILEAFFDAFVEEHIIQPTFIYEYPVEISPLAKRSPKNPEMTERFEAFVNHSEIANAFSELNDAQDQRRRFEKQVERREAGDDEANLMDTDFVNALEVGLPPTGGLGIGVDRLIMFLTNQSSIRDVLLFPTMKPFGLKSGDAEATESETAAAEASAKPIDFSKVEIEPLFREQVDFETFSKSDFRAVKVLACEAVKKSKKLLQFTLDDGTGEPRTILSGIRAHYEPEALVGKTLIAITNLPPRAMMGVESCGMLLSAIHTEAGEEKLQLLMVDPHIPAGAKLY